MTSGDIDAAIERLTTFANDPSYGGTLPPMTAIPRDLRALLSAYRAQRRALSLIANRGGAWAGVARAALNREPANG